MPELIERSWSLLVGGILLEASTIDFTVKFEIMKSTAREPNTANIQVANLSPSTCQRLQSLDAPQIELRAGYVDLEDLIFVGDARDIYTLKDATERWTHIEAEDGGTAYREEEIQRSFGAGTPVWTVIRACADALGVGAGNTDDVAARATLENGEDNYATGITLSGLAWRALDNVCRSCDLRWSVQSGVLQLREQGRPAEIRAIRLSPSTGLVGSPTRGKRDERTRKVTYGVKSLLIPGLYPGRVVALSSQEVSGNFMVKKVRYTGETTGPEWYAILDLEEYDA